jgi:ABC-type nitrate/sulfonate/bicarbonate transport system ATPase subunit
MKEPQPLLSIKKLYITNGSQTLVKNFNLELTAGDYKTISAPTGTGKTTLFNYIADILPQDTFKVTGEMIKAPDLRIAYAFQEPRLIPSISVLKNVMLPLQNLMDPQRAESVARVWLQRFKLSHKVLDLPENLSGGEKQRANLARSFAYASAAGEGPLSKLLLLDEPFSSQDEQNAQNIISLIKEMLFIPNTAVLLITHDRTFLNDNSIIPW